MAKFRVLLGATLASILVIAFQNCGQELKLNSSLNQLNSNQNNNHNNDDSTPPATDETPQKPDCSNEENKVCFFNIRGIHRLSGDNKILMIDTGTNQLIEHNLETGHQEKVLTFPSNYKLDFSSNSGLLSQNKDRLYLSVYYIDPSIADISARQIDFLIEINLVDYSFREVSGPNVGMGDEIEFFSAPITMSSDGEKIYTSFGFPSKLMEIDILTGNRVILHDESTETDQLSLQNILPSDDSNVFYFTDYDSNQGARLLYQLNLSNGTRTAISGGNLGNGDILIDDITSYQQSDEANKLIGLTNNGKVLEIDLTTGNRTLLWEPPADSLIDRFFHTASLNYSPEKKDLYLGDSTQDQIFYVNLENQTYAKIAESRVGSGDKLGDLYAGRSFYHDEANKKVYATSGRQGSVFRVDLETSRRVVIAKTDDGLGPDIGYVSGITLSEDGKWLYVTNIFWYLFKINLETGIREYFSSWDEVDPIGTGPDIFACNGIVLNQSNTHAYASDQNSRNFFRIDLATGNREVAHDATTGSGPATDSLDYIISVNPTETIIFYSRQDPESGFADIMQVDLASGVRSVALANVKYPPKLSPNSQFVYVTDESGEITETDLWSQSSATKDPATLDPVIFWDAKRGALMERNFVEQTDSIVSY